MSRYRIDMPPGWADDVQLSGPCCACRRNLFLRHVILMGFRGPVPGRGWGCQVCGLPENGAIAVVCDECMALDAPIVDVCSGWAADGGRVEAGPLRCLVWQHDPAVHVIDESDSWRN